jgi:beta-lactamase regulating signal transducer with metallopeptidase domain
MIAAMIKSAIVLALAACIASLMKRQSAAVRHTVWTAGLIGALAIPLATITLPSWKPEIAVRAITALQGATSGFVILRQGIVAVWLVGAAAGMALLLHGALRLAWVAVRSEPVEDARWSALADEVRTALGIRRPVRLLQNRTVPFLGTWGIVVPRVLLPDDAEKWSDDRVRMVLAHELSHIKRLDWVVQVLADAARAIYWFNPIFWLASSRLRRESEHACDDAVLRLGVAGTTYAEELLAMTRALRSERGAEQPILAMAQPSHLEQRLIALLNPSLNRLASTPWAVLVVAGFAIALTLPLAAVKSTEPAPAAVSVASVVKSEPATPAPAPAPVEKHVEAPAIPAPKIAPQPAVVETPAPAPPPPPPFQCNITASNFATKTKSVEKSALGNGPWIINSDQTIWAADQPYVANRTTNTVWMRPANTELTVTGRRLDAEAPQLQAGPAAPYSTGYVAVGLTFPVAGCWEITATAGDSKLTFTTKVLE